MNDRADVKLHPYIIRMLLCSAQHRLYDYYYRESRAGESPYFFSLFIGAAPTVSIFRRYRKTFVGPIDFRLVRPSHVYGQRGRFYSSWTHDKKINRKRCGIVGVYERFSKNKTENVLLKISKPHLSHCFALLPKTFQMSNVTRFCYLRQNINIQNTHTHCCKINRISYYTKTVVAVA